MTVNPIIREPETEVPAERKGCAECGATDVALVAPRPNVGKGYSGPMHCVGCSPRFGGGMLGMHYSSLEAAGV